MGGGTTLMGVGRLRGGALLGGGGAAVGLGGEFGGGMTLRGAIWGVGGGLG